LKSLSRLGDFLIQAQMPLPQPGWSQQYNYSMQPIWARPFEPPAIASDESQEVVETLMLIYDVTADEKFLAPILPTLEYLRKSRLPDGRLARYYELKSNKPLYMTRSGKIYSLTYDDSKLPSHYGWKIDARVDKLQKAHDDRVSGRKRVIALDYLDLRADVTRIVKQVDAEGRWVSVYNGERLVGEPKIAKGARYLSSEVFSRNVELLSRFVDR
jgi:hypothetical protein